MDTVTKRILLTPLNILYRIAPRLELRLLFRLKQGYKLNLKDPKTFNEKLQWIKLYDRNPLMPKCVDKYTVREYVESVGCGEILNELIWEGFNPEDIPFDKLPKKFVIKVTHGSTFNIICTDKNKLDREDTIKKCKKWLKEKFLPCYGEWFYGVEKPRVVVEKYIESENGLKDYKVFCFNGEPKYIGVYSERETGHTKQELYDVNWKRIDGFTGSFESPAHKTPKPKSINRLLDYARKLSADFKHVRVDFFIENEEIIFGELTFTSGAGFDKFTPRSLAEEMGENLRFDDEKIKVLMVGPARDVKGGMTTVVDGYYACGLSKKVDLKYIESINDKNKVSKFIKERIGFKEYKKVIEDYDIVHIHMASHRSTFRKIKYIKVANKYNKKIVLHIHGGGFQDFIEKEVSQRKREYIVNNINKVDTIIVLSDAFKDYLSNIVTTKVIIINNSVKIPDDFEKEFDNTLLFLGRLNKEKGIYELLEAIKHVKEKYNDVRLYIAGSGDECSIKKIINTYNLNKEVILLGWVSGEEKENYLKKASYFVLPSHYEAMPMSLLEAMSYKCIPIVSNIGGMKAIVKNMRNGYLVEPLKQDELSSSIEMALSMKKDDRALMSNMAREEVVNKYDETKIIKELIRVYGNCCESKYNAGEHYEK